MLNVPNDVTKVNLLMSGGSDSTLLLFLLIEENMKRERPFVIQNHTTIANGRIDYTLVKPILSWFNDRFGIQMYTKAYRKLDLGTIWIREVATKIIEKEGGVVYSGCNKAPEEAINWKLRGGRVPTRGVDTHPLHYRPFLDLTKADLYKIWLQKDIPDLLALTKSCSRPINEKDCGVCFFCREWEWARQTVNN